MSQILWVIVSPYFYGEHTQSLRFQQHFVHHRHRKVKRNVYVPPDHRVTSALVRTLVFDIEIGCWLLVCWISRCSEESIRAGIESALSESNYGKYHIVALQSLNDFSDIVLK